MSKIKLFKVLTLISILLFIILSGCGKLTKVNPNEPPFNLQLTKINQNRIELSWEYNYTKNDTLQYYVYRQIGDDYWNLIAELDKDIKVYGDLINTNDTLLYSYKVAVYKASEEQLSEYSDVVAYFSEYADPSEFAVTQISDKKLKLEWKDNCIGEDGYKIEKKIDNGDWFVLTNMATSPYIDNVEPFENIKYKIYAYKGITKSKYLEQDILSSIMAPDSLTLQSYQEAKILLNWKDNSNNETNYVVEKKIGSLDWQQIAILDSNTVSYIDDNNLIAATISYRVKAINGNNSSLYSNEASINILLNQVGEYDTPGDAVDLSVQSHDFGIIAYIADMYSGLTVVDCSHPNNLDGKTFNEGLTDRIYSVDSKENVCYFTIHDDPSFHNGFGMLDLTEINNGNYNEVDTLYVIGYTQLSNIPYDVATYSSYSYIATGTDGISVMISQGPPHIVSTLSTNGDARKCVINGTNLYVANGMNGGLAIIDISNPMNPVLISNLPLDGFAKDIAAFGNYVYLANAEGGLAIIDVSDPSNPTVTANVNTGGLVSSVYYKNNAVYLADWNNGFYIINIDDVNNPYIQGFKQMDTQPRAIQVAGSYAFILDNQGLKIIQISQ